MSNQEAPAAGDDDATLEEFVETLVLKITEHIFANNLIPEPSADNEEPFFCGAFKFNDDDTVEQIDENTLIE